MLSMEEKGQLIRNKTKEFGLLVDESFIDASNIQIATACNGCGPDKWPEKLRELIGSLVSEFDSVWDSHDWDFYMADGTLKGFYIANLRMKANMLSVIKRISGFSFNNIHTYKNIFKWYLLIKKRQIICELMEEFGWSAYAEASVKNGIIPEYPIDFNLSMIGVRV